MNAMAVETEPLRRIAHLRPARVCEAIELGEAGRAALAQDPSPSQFLSTLIMAECHEDAVRYLAHALPRPDAVRWACDCVQALQGAALSVTAVAALGAVRRWLAHPGAAQCREAAEAAEAEGMKDQGAARFATLAAAWSGESLAPEGMPPTAPAPELGALAVTAAVMIAAAHGEPGRMVERYRECLSRGILMARAAATV